MKHILVAGRRGRMKGGQRIARGDEQVVELCVAVSASRLVDFLVDRLLEAERQGADVAMVSVMPHDRADVLILRRSRGGEMF